MEISHQPLSPDITIVHLHGRLDATANPIVRSTLQKLINEKQLKIILDLKGVSFIDSSGLAALVSGLRLAREQAGNIVLSGAQPHAQTVFRLTMLDRVFSIHPTHEEAKQILV
ncbi:MAG: STAS domain-containing protein [Anaerolineae bacterium]|nr:STAS domain-containing protein [Anaerolineae bacterium]